MKFTIRPTRRKTNKQFSSKCLVEMFHPTREVRDSKSTKGYELVGNDNEVVNDGRHMETYRPHTAGRLQSGLEKSIQYISSAKQTFRSDMGFTCNPLQKKSRPFFIHHVHLMLNNSVENIFLNSKKVDKIIVFNPDTARNFCLRQKSGQNFFSKISQTAPSDQMVRT